MSDTERPAATAADLRALGHPLRLRILRLCIDTELTNAELAAELDRDPGTVLHHVRTLVEHGFLRPTEPRRGRRGAVERPYTITGKSWRLRMGPSAAHTRTVLQAVAEELADAPDDAVITTVRLGVRLTDADVADLRARLQGIGDEFVQRDDPAGTAVGIVLAAHRQRR